MSKRASTWSSPLSKSPSRATSRPGMKPSTRSCRAASPSAAAASGVRRMLSSRRTAPMNWASSSARITPRLAESVRGLTTHGNTSRRASTTGSSPKERRAYGGTGTPFARSSVRIRYLSRAAAVDRTGVVREVQRVRQCGGQRRLSRRPRPPRRRSGASRRTRGPGAQPGRDGGSRARGNGLAAPAGRRGPALRPRRPPHRASGPRRGRPPCGTSWSAGAGEAAARYFFEGAEYGFCPAAWSVTSRISTTSGTSSRIIVSMPCFSVTSAIPHPWQPPPIWR